MAMPPRLVLALRHTADKDFRAAAGQVTGMQLGESGLKQSAPGRGLGLGEQQGSVLSKLPGGTCLLSSALFMPLGSGPLKMHMYVLVFLSSFYT